MQIALPEPLLEDVFRATQVHCLMAARNEADGRRVAPWIASDAYGPLDTEAQPVILGMSLVGQEEFARRGLDFFVASYNADGLLAKGYTLMGTGQHLWTLGEHYAIHPDPTWLEQIAPEILKSCRWIVRQTEKTKRLDAGGQPVPEYGLAPPGVLADWDRYAYYLYANAYYCAGLDAATDLLASVRPQEADCAATSGGGLSRECPAGFSLAARADARRAAARRHLGIARPFEPLLLRPDSRVLRRRQRDRSRCGSRKQPPDSTGLAGTSRS